MDTNFTNLGDDWRKWPLEAQVYLHKRLGEILDIERWAIRVATITPATFDEALPAVKRFYAAGGNEEMFKKLEQYTCKYGGSLIQLLEIVASLIPRGIVK